jgi:hypothetical protein
VTTSVGRAGLFAVVSAALALIAWASPAPDRVTDRDVYEATAALTIVPDCSDLHCFRVLVPWALSVFPGDSTVRWKGYAVLSNAGAAIAVLILCPVFGLSRRASVLAASASAFGFGSLYTLHDPFTADPLMFLLGPLVTWLALTNRIWIAAALGAVGVLAKEFAAAPLYLVAGYRAIGRQAKAALATLAAGNLAFIVWVALTLTLMVRFNYTWGATDSANLVGGAGIGPWLQRQSLRGILSAMFNEFGALYVLAPVGLLLSSPPLRKLSLVSLPIAAVFSYVEQPDRALWNFHFLVTPLAAITLEGAPAPLAWLTLLAFALGNMRVGAQLPMASVGRLALAASVVLACAAAVFTLRAAGARSRGVNPSL